MKFMKKALSVFMAVLMLFSALSVSLVAYAADAELADAYSELAYRFFSYTTNGGNRIVEKDENGIPEKSIVGVMDQYEVSNSSDDYVYADDQDNPIRSVAYNHVVNAKDDMPGNIREAFLSYMKIADASLSYTYGEGYYTLPLLNDAVKEELKFIKGDDGEYLFLDGYTYLVSAIGNIVGRSSEPTYRVVNGKIVDLGIAIEDIEWDITGTVGEERTIAEQISSAALRAQNLYEACNVATVIDYFGGNCTTVNSGSWFHKYTFNCRTDLETAILSHGLTAVGMYLVMYELSVEWSFGRQFDDSGTKAQYYNKGYNLTYDPDDFELNLIPNDLWDMKDRMTELFNTYYDSGSRLSQLDASSLPTEYGKLADDIALFESLPDSVKLAVFGKDAFSFVNIYTQLKPIVASSDASEEEINEYLPKHTYEKYKDADGNPITYDVTVDKVTDVVSSIDNLLSDTRVGSILKMFIDIDAESDKPIEILRQFVTDSFFTDDTINMILGALYPMLSNLIDENLTNDMINGALDGLAPILTTLINWLTDNEYSWLALIYQLIGELNVALTPAGFAYVMSDRVTNYAAKDSNYKAIHDTLMAAEGGTLYRGIDDTSKKNFSPYKMIPNEGDGLDGHRWDKVDFDSLVWGVTDEASFKSALTCVLAPIAPLLAYLFGNQRLDLHAADLDFDLGLFEIDLIQLWGRVENVNLYDWVLYPLFEALGINTAATPATFQSLANTYINNQSAQNLENFLLGGLIDPLLDWIFDEEYGLLAHPIETILTLLPNLSYYLTSGALVSSLDIAVTIQIQTADAGGGSKLTVYPYELKIMELIGDSLDLSMLSSIQGILDMVGLPVSLPDLMESKLQSTGTLVTGAPSARQSNLGSWPARTRNYIDMQVGEDNIESYGLVLFFLFRYLLSGLMYRPYAGGEFTTDETLLDSFGLDVSDELMDGFSLGDIINNIALHPDEAIASLYELFYQNENGSMFTYDDVRGVLAGKPYKYSLEYVNYYTDTIMKAADKSGDYGYGAGVLYTKYWTQEDAKYVVDNIYDIVENVLAMLKLDGMDSINKLLSDLLVDNVFNNDMVSNLVGMIYGLLDGMDFDLSAILGPVLGVDYSKETLMKALNYEFDNAFDYNPGSNEVYTKLLDDVIQSWQVGGESFKKYDDTTFYDENGEALDWGFNNAKITENYTPAEIFVKAVSAALAPFSILIKFLFAGEDLNILDLVHIPGYEAYHYSWIPLMDTLLATSDSENKNKMLSFEEYFTKIYASREDDNGNPIDAATLTIMQNCDTVYYLVSPLLNVIDKALADPVSYVLSMLPNLLFFLSIGGINGFANNLVHFAYVLLDILQPVFDAYPLINSLISNLSLGDGIVLNLSLPLDIDVNQLVNTLIESLLGDMLSFDIESNVYEGVTGTLKITLPYLDLTTLCAGTVRDVRSVSGERIIILDSSDGADLLTTILRLVVDTLFYEDNAMNIADFLIEYCQLDDEVDNDELLIEIFSYLNMRAHQEEFPDKILWLILQIYKILVPIADNIGGRFKGVDFSITDIFDNIDNMDQVMDYLRRLLGGDNAEPNPTLNAFQRLIELIKQFFAKLQAFFAGLFGIG